MNPCPLRIISREQMVRELTAPLDAEVERCVESLNIAIQTKAKAVDYNDGVVLYIEMSLDQLSEKHVVKMRLLSMLREAGWFAELKPPSDMYPKGCMTISDHGVCPS